MPVGVRVRDSFRRCLGDSVDRPSTPPSSIHSWARNGGPATRRPWATAGKDPARVLSFRIRVGIGQPWSAWMLLQGRSDYRRSTRVVEVETTATVFSDVARYGARMGGVLRVSVDTVSA
jgi:hypothetical protein